MSLLREKIGSIYTDVYLPLRNRLEYRDESIPRYDIDRDTDVIIITVDCLRKDRVSPHNPDRDTTPFLSEIFSQHAAVSASSWTYSSVPSILTGSYPHEHGAAYPDDSSRNQDMENPPALLADNTHTLPEIVSTAGYSTYFSTGITTAALPLKGRVPNLSINPDADVNTMLSDLSDWWTSQTRGERFAYVHLADLHEPLHQPNIEHFGEIADIEGIDRWRFEKSTTPTSEFQDYREARIHLYDTLLRDIDSAIEEFVAELEERNELEDTVLLVTSDHGEEFWEWCEEERRLFSDPRGIYGVGHGHALVPEVVEVPIFLLGTGMNESNERRSTVDIAPTILKQLDGPQTVIDSCAGYPLQNKTPDGRVCLSEEIAYGNNQISLTRGSDHLIYTPTTEETVHIDLETRDIDTDVSRNHPLLDYLPEGRVVGDQSELDDTTKQQLEDLGYA